MPTRFDGRTDRALRPTSYQAGFQRCPEGSILYRCGGTTVLCACSIEEKVPPFLEGRGTGWVTAEYAMHPRANPDRRQKRSGGDKVDGRSQEIQRLIGRSLRAAVHMDKLGERTLSLDCDVLEADGGTRTASITGGMVAVAIALSRLLERGLVKPGVLRAPVAAVSVGIVNGEALLDLAYVEDSRAQVDLNVVATASGDVIEIQGTAEGAPVPRKEIDRLIDLGLHGISLLATEQRAAMREAGVQIERLLGAEG
ncbi:MAG TPA: ribonuclease PH [Polyangiales bacterium]